MYCARVYLNPGNVLFQECRNSEIYVNKIGLILLSSKFQGLDDEQLDALFGIAGLKVEEVLDASNARERADAIAKYLKLSYDSSQYVLLDSEDLSCLHPKLRGHVYVLKQGKRIDYGQEEKIRHILYYGPWWSYLYAKATTPRRIGKKLIEEEIEKVIFLDIDGVLNDDGPEARIQAVNPRFVANLAEIVKNTGAAIILSSSWRGAVMSFLNYGGECEDVDLLLKLMKKNGIAISGCTPNLMSGPDGRPYEIRTWLANRPNVKRFVILDDETFWKWGWLEQFVVCTRESSGSWREPDICGLDEKYVKQAIQLLTERKPA